MSSENTGGAVGRCLEPHDLAFSKLTARREKDITFVSNMLRFGLISTSRLEKLIHSVEDKLLRESLNEALALCRAA